MKVSQRTKNRLREHPDMVDTGKRSNDILGMPGILCALMESPDGWIGWIPVSELPIGFPTNGCGG